MNRKKQLNLIGILLLLSATIVWGTSFFILKETIQEVPTFFVIAIRFIVAGLLLCLIFINKVKNLDRKTIVRGIILGLLLASAYMTQTLGLERTTPGRNAFLTSSYCVMCPFLIWILFKKKPKFYNVISAILCIIGIGLVSLSNTDEGGNYLLGDGLTLISAIFFGFQIIFIDKFQKEGFDTIKMLLIELLTVGIIFTMCSLIFELPKGIKSYSLNANQALKIAYLTLFCTFYAQSAQILGQKFTSANQSSIILSLESVFGVLFSVIFANEKLTFLIILGFVIIFIAMMISELGADMFKKKKQNPQIESD